MLEAAKAVKLESLSRFKRMLVSKARRRKFDHEEISEQLLSAVIDGRHPGIVEVLRDLILAQGGDINYCRRKSKSWQQIEQRSIFLAVAATNGNIDLVQLLAPSVDQTSLDESLHIALSLDISPHQWNVITVELLLANHADASREYRAFCAALESRNSDVVELLLNAPKPISHECVSDSLCSAVRLGFLDILFLLVLAGADGNATALKEAAKRGRLDLLVAITLCQKPPPAKSLDEAVEITFSDNEDIGLQQKLWMMDVLLSNGARGSSTDSTLVKIARKMLSQPESTTDSTLHDMMRLLVRHDASINHKNGAALKSCVSKNRIDLAETLLAAKDLEIDIASETLAMIDFTNTPEVKVRMASMLLARGAHGTPLHEALIQAVAINHLGAVETLVLRREANKASVDYRHAQALQDAVSGEKLQIVEVLLTASPTLESLCFAFRHIRKTSKQGRFWLSRALLRRGAKGVVVHQSLSAAVADETPMRDERLVQLLVEAGGNVDQHLEAAVAKRNKNLLRLLLGGRPSVQAVSESLLASLQTPEQETRLQMIGLLLDAGADVNFLGGEAILRATQSYDLVSLETLLKSRPKPESLDTAFSATTATMNPRQRYNIYWRLIDAGAAGDAVNEAIVVVVGEQSDDLDIFQLLIPNGSVDYGGGRALCLAIKHRLRKHVSLLLQKKPQAETFQNAFKEALALDDEGLQLVFCRMLLQAGPEEEFTCSPIKYAEKGLCHECQSQHPRLLELLMYYQAKDRLRKNEGEELLDIINSRPDPSPKGQQRAQLEEGMEAKMEEYRLNSALGEDLQQNPEQRQRMSRAGKTRRKSSPPKFGYQVQDFDFGSSERAAWALAPDSTPRTSRNLLGIGGQENELNIDRFSIEAKDRSTDNTVRSWERVSAVDREGGDENETRRRRPALRVRPATTYGQLANRSSGRIAELDV
jgi:hypothetical protein